MDTESYTHRGRGRCISNANAPNFEKIKNKKNNNSDNTLISPKGLYCTYLFCNFNSSVATREDGVVSLKAAKEEG